MNTETTMETRAGTRAARKSHLIFRLQGALYGVDVDLVQEIVWLPRLTAIAGRPFYEVGVFDLRGRIVPVIDLALRLRFQPAPYLVSDCVIVLGQQKQELGVIVNEVLDVCPAAYEATLDEGDGNNDRTAVLAGTVELNDQIVVLLNHAVLLASEPPEPLPDEALAREPTMRVPVFCPDASPAEAELFARRAQLLKRRDIRGEAGGREPYAIIRLDSEHFGVRLAGVREFVEIRQVVPVPCSPPHILGSMNLRGNVVTLVDIRPLLGLSSENSRTGKAIILKAGDHLLGLLVADILDVVYLRSAEFTEMPVGSAAAGNEEFLLGATFYGDILVTVIDLSQIIDRGGLQVQDGV